MLIIASQVPPALGVRGGGGSVITAAADGLADPAAWSAPALAFAVGALSELLVPGIVIAIVGWPAS